jgi:hypothetical protein
MTISYSISGRHRNDEAVRIYVCNLFKALKIQRLSSKQVDIYFRTKLDADTLGLCMGDTDEVFIDIAKTSYNNKLSFLAQMMTLAHEMTHAKQFLRGELAHNRDGEFLWRSKCARGYKYKNQPWEKEAERLEKVLFMECFPFHLDIK